MGVGPMVQPNSSMLDFAHFVRATAVRRTRLVWAQRLGFARPVRSRDQGHREFRNLISPVEPSKIPRLHYERCTRPRLTSLANAQSRAKILNLNPAVDDHQSRRME